MHFGVWVMTQQVRALAALAEDLSLILDMHARWLTTICNSNYRESDSLSGVGSLATESTLILADSVMLNRRFQRVDTMAKVSQ